MQGQNCSYCYHWRVCKHKLFRDIRQFFGFEKDCEYFKPIAAVLREEAEAQSRQDRLRFLDNSITELSRQRSEKPIEPKTFDKCYICGEKTKYVCGACARPVCEKHGELEDVLDPLTMKSQERFICCNCEVD